VAAAAVQPVVVAIAEADADADVVEHKVAVVVQKDWEAVGQVQKDWEVVARTAAVVVAVNVLHAAAEEDLVAHTGPAWHVPDDAVTAVDAEVQQDDEDDVVVVVVAAGTHEDAELAQMAGACCFQWEKAAVVANAVVDVAALGVA
jgi:hypothetical protein